MPGSRYRILHVEDNPGDADMVRRQLMSSTEPGFDVESVTTLAQAHRSLGESGVDAVLLDLGLPDSMGLETLEGLKSAVGVAPVIVLSGSVDDALRCRAIQLGAEDVLSKDDANSLLFSRAVLYVIERSGALARQSQVEKLLDATPDGILIVDEGGVVRYLNQAAVRLFGRDHADLVGERLGFSVANGKTAEVVVPRNGEAHICELRVAPFEWEGRPAHLATLRDVTAVRSSQTRFERLAESGIIGIVTADLSGRILDANDTFLQAVGYSRAELGRGELAWAHLVGPEDPEARRGLLWRTRESSSTALGSFPPQSVETFEVEMVRRDGTRAPHLVVSAMVEPTRITSFTLDLSEKRSAEWGRLQAEVALRSTEEQLRQAQKMEAVGRLAGGIAHDFNNILSVILGHGELVLTSMPPGDPLRQDVDEIHRAGERAARLTKQLLMFSRKQVLEPRNLDINEILVSMGTMLDRVLGEDITLRIKTSTHLGRVRADRGGIEQVIMNLVVNARDAMPKGGRLTIETADVELDEDHAARHVGVKPGPHVMIAVTDSGIGMDKDTQSQIFDPFFTTKEVGRGTGLGLSTVFGIVNQSGGSVWVYSELGHGTTFKVYLPRIEASATVESKAPTQPAGGRETILLVEDEDQVRNVAASILRRFGYRVLEARNGADALSEASAHPSQIHLLISDVVMPRMGGLELATQLSLCRPDVRVLFMSGYTDDSVVRHGVLTEAISYLEKPFTVEALTRKVRELLDAHVEPRAS